MAGSVRFQCVGCFWSANANQHKAPKERVRRLLAIDQITVGSFETSPFVEKAFLDDNMKTRWQHRRPASAGNAVDQKKREKKKRKRRRGQTQPDTVNRSTLIGRANSQGKATNEDSDGRDGTALTFRGREGDTDTVSVRCTALWRENSAPTWHGADEDGWQRIRLNAQKWCREEAL